MTDRYLLDTNILSAALRDPGGEVGERLADAPQGATCTSVIVAGELRFGAAKRGSRRLMTRVAELLETIDVLPFQPPADLAYAALRTDLERIGRPIGGNDMLIAAHALSLGLILVTDNQREFSRVANLRIENWLR